MRAVDAVEHATNFRIQFLPEVVGGELQARLNVFSNLLDADAGIAILRVHHPAFALGDDLVTKFLLGQLVSPLAECAFGELLNIAFVH